MPIFQEQHRQRDVVVTNSQATAELLEMTLMAHGVQALTRAYDWAHPSLNWVQGYRVAVPEDEADLARDVLDALSGRGDVQLLDDDVDLGDEKAPGPDPDDFDLPPE